MMNLLLMNSTNAQTTLQFERTRFSASLSFMMSDIWDSCNKSNANFQFEIFCFPVKFSRLSTANFFLASMPNKLDTFLSFT